MATAGLAARLLGGLGVWLRSPSVRQGPFARSYADMDFAITAAASKPFRALLQAEGYLPDQFFNGMHGATRLYYGTADGRWSIDVVIDELAMSHKLDLRGRLNRPGPTITPADLLLSKLQVWQITRKDLGDALCLLADIPLSEDDASTGAISLARIRAVLGNDWGFCHTVERNLGRLDDLRAGEPLASVGQDIAENIQAVRRAIETAPKSMAWRMRSRVGERVRWYETPEEVRH